jgi:ribosomal protein L11 methyltransferase
MPYRLDLRKCSDGTFDRLIELGAVDFESSNDGAIAALLPDNVAPEQVACAVGGAEIVVSPTQALDNGSVWVLSRRPVRIGRLRIVPAATEPEAGDIRLADTSAFGSGLHPTTVLCLESLDEAVQLAAPDSVLDVGTGSGVLALAALTLGVPRATGIDINEGALRAAAWNARANGLGDRLHLALGGPDGLTGTWPLVLANVLPGPLIDMAPLLVQRVGHGGRIVLSGIPRHVENEVDQAYRRLGMWRMRTRSRSGWVALEMRASW